MFLVAILALVALSLLTGGGDGRSDNPGGSGDPAAADGREPTSTIAPPDVDEPRASVDLTAVPTGDDPVELARWWAATYTAHVGSDLPAALADRLAPVITDALRAQLAALPPAASYDSEPVAVEGVSQPGPVTEGDNLRIRVSVETAAALSSYDLTLVAAAGTGRWLVDQASRL